MARKPLIAGNWKMNLNHLEAISTVQKLAFALPKEYYEKVDVAVTVPFTDLRSVQTLVEGDKLEITYGAQDVSQHESGAYTGEVSAEMLSKLGVTWVVVGHSERREYHGETDALVAAKAAIALAHNLHPIVCGRTFGSPRSRHSRRPCGRTNPQLPRRAQRRRPP